MTDNQQKVVALVTTRLEFPADEVLKLFEKQKEEAGRDEGDTWDEVIELGLMDGMLLEDPADEIAALIEGKYRSFIESFAEIAYIEQLWTTCSGVCVICKRTGDELEWPRESDKGRVEGY